MTLSLWKLPEYWDLLQCSEAMERRLAEAASQVRYHRYAAEELADLSVLEAKADFGEALFMAAMFRQKRKGILLEVRATHLPQGSANDDCFDLPGGAA